MSRRSANFDICFVIGSLETGGAEMHLATIAPKLAQAGYSITVYNISGTGALGNKMSEHGVHVLGPPIRFQRGLARLFQPLILGLSSIRLFGFLVFHRPRIVHFFLPHAYILGAVAAKCAGLNRLVMSRRSLNYYQIRHPIMRLIERRLHRSMRVILGNSRAVIDQLRNDEGVPKEKLCLIYNGVVLDQFASRPDKTKKRKMLEIRENALVMVIVANLIPYKGHAELLEALSIVRSKLPRDWLLLVVGKDAGIGRQLRDQAATSGIADSIRFLGPRNDVADILHISDIGLLCSHEEGFSNAILEAMAAGLPMVVTDVGGNSEAVQNEKTGFVVPAKSPAELGGAIVRLTNNERLRKHMGKKATARVKRKFGIKTCIDAYDDLYQLVGADTNRT